ncbi:hypothetical protein [Streptomyces platensis]|uniref:hypothetical protein n=1 Tax=Streptomyces platensis TaxID=58346 RepID=UPI00386C852B|nr:hypothetical protein OG962_01140 [Streptomyces platensis]
MAASAGWGCSRRTGRPTASASMGAGQFFNAAQTGAPGLIRAGLGEICHEPPQLIDHDQS